MTGDAPIRLEPADRVEVTVVVDNFVDLLMAGSDDVNRYAASDFGDRDQLVAEHGFSALVTIDSGGQRSQVLYDGGLCLCLDLGRIGRAGPASLRLLEEHVASDQERGKEHRQSDRARHEPHIGTFAAVHE